MASMDDDDSGPLERLVDDSRERPGEAPWVRLRAIELVKSVDPFEVASGRKQRLLLSVGHGSVRRPSPWLRPAVVGMILIGSGALASAALTSWPTRILHTVQAFIAPRAEPASASQRKAEHPGVTIEPRAAEPTPAPALPARPAQRRVAAEVHARGRSPVESPSDDTALLIEAARALRVERNPTRARALANRYLERQPTGALADEALAISIEAAVDQHDPDAVALSARYLQQFPRGPFRGLAQRTLASPPARR